MRRILPSLAAVSALLALAVLPTPARASATGTATYTLTSSADIPAPDPNSAGPQVIAEVLPPEGVVPPKLPDGSEGSPLTVLPDSTGFDPSHLVVALKDTTDSSGNPQQLFGLAFFGSGFKANGNLHFTLSVDGALSTPPVLKSDTPGVSIALEQLNNTGSSGGQAGGTTTPTTTPTNNTPEPMSMLLWSVLAGAGLSRGRRFRKAKAEAA